MSYLSLYRRWRPATFSEVLGQSHVTETLQGALREGRVAHAYLFAGPRGTGKTSTARILAKALNCERGVSPEPCGVCRPCTEIAEGSCVDVFEMDAASHTSVDDVREIRERIPFAPVAGGHKVYIIDEAHQLSTPAFNALLKMLEEPPPHVVFVLCTTEAHKLPATVVSRCQRFEFRRLSTRTLAGHLAAVAQKEGIEATEGALEAIARHAHGSVRDALAVLDQAVGMSEGKVTRDTVAEILGETPFDVLSEISDALAAGDVPSCFRAVERAVERGWDPRQLLRQLLEHLRGLLWARWGADELLDLDDEERGRLREQAARFDPSHLAYALRVLGESQADLRWSAHPRLTLEVALARAAVPGTEDVGALRARVERLERLLARWEEPKGPRAPGAGAPAAQAGVARPGAAAGGGVQAGVAEGPVVQAGVAEGRGAQVGVAEGPVVQAPASEAPGAQPSPPGAQGSAPETQPAPPPPGTLAEQWAAFVEQVRRRKKTTHALLREAWPIALEGGVLVVGFEKTFHAEAIQRPDHAPHLQAAAEAVFGRRLRLRPEVRSSERPKAPGVPGMAEDPVELVVRSLGAEVVEER